MASEAEDARTILSCAAPSLPPPHAFRDLLSVGVCVRCIFRLFGVCGHVYACPVLTASSVLSFLEEQNNCCSASSENGLLANGHTQWSCASSDSESGCTYCCICLGILQLTSDQDQDLRTCKGEASVNDYTMAIVELLKKEAHEIDDFSIEISLPPAVVANDRAIWLYMKKKYNSEEWFSCKLQNSDQISVKDALRLSITSSIANQLGVKSGVSSFRIRLTFTNEEASRKLQNSLSKDHCFRRRKTETKGNGHIVNDPHNRNGTSSTERNKCDSDAVIYHALDGLQDDVFSELFTLPPEKANSRCQLTIACYRTPMYIGGRYLKFSRKVSQSRWMIDDERMGEASVEEIIGNNMVLVCRGDSYKFHAAGREDIDVRMLGSGRPFLVEVSNARIRPSMVAIEDVTDKINKSKEKYVGIRNLKLVGSEAWALMREGEAEKEKQYAALVWISRPLTEEDMQHISSIKDLDILQNTPIRVLHRRSPMARKKIIHWMNVEKIAGSNQYFLLHLCTQAGTYIKEFVHGDLGRTHPSIGSILGCRAEILQLDVTDVKMDCFE